MGSYRGIQTLSTRGRAGASATMAICALALACMAMVGKFTVDLVQRHSTETNAARAVSGDPTLTPQQRADGDTVLIIDAAKSVDHWFEKANLPGLDGASARACIERLRASVNR